MSLAIDEKLRKCLGTGLIRSLVPSTMNVFVTLYLKSSLGMASTWKNDSVFIALMID